MKIRLATLLGLGMALASSGVAFGQSRGGHGVSMRAPAPAGASVARAATVQISPIQVRNNLRVIHNPRIIHTDGFFDGAFPVPGLGFDFAHFAAVHPNSHTRFFRRPIAVGFPGTFPFFGGEPGPQVIVLQQPPVVVMQQPVIAEETDEPAPRGRTLVREENFAAAPLAQHLPDVGEFILVRRDGGLLFAVAFFMNGDQLTYVTREGVRRSVALADLDFETTRRMNEERGTSLHLPA